MKVKMKYLIPLVLTSVMLVIYYFGRDRVEENDVADYEIKFLERVEKEEKSLDINYSSVKEFMNAGLSIKIAKEVEEYIEFTGKVEDLEELVRIKGIGIKTVDKLRGKFYIDKKKGKKIKLDINSATEKNLVWYGFSNKEIIKIMKFRKDNGKVYSNVELMGIIGEERYDILGKDISYNTVKKN